MDQRELDAHWTKAMRELGYAEGWLEVVQRRTKADLVEARLAIKEAKKVVAAWDRAQADARKRNDLVVKLWNKADPMQSA